VRALLVVNPAATTTTPRSREVLKRALGSEPPLAGDYLLALDRMVGLASRGLLIPADSWLLKVRRRLDLRAPWF